MFFPREAELNSLNWNIDSSVSSVMALTWRSLGCCQKPVGIKCVFNWKMAGKQGEQIFIRAWSSHQYVRLSVFLLPTKENISPASETQNSELEDTKAIFFLSKFPDLKNKNKEKNQNLRSHFQLKKEYK